MDYRFDTLATHAGYTPDKEHHAMQLPIYQTSAYEFESVQYAKDLFELKAPGNIYTRLSNPTVDALERRTAALEGGIGALAMASGHASMVATFLNLAECGDEIVSSISIYGGAINMMGVTLGKMGIKVKFIDGDDLAAWESAITDKTKAFFVELVGNPNANVADVQAIADIAHKNGIPFIVDGTFCTPYLCRLKDFGADYIVHSATKYMSGNGTSMAGITVDCGSFDFMGNPRFPQYNNPDVSYHGAVFGKDFGSAGFITRLRALMLRDLGACLAPFNAFLIMLGLETLSLRMQRHSDNALTVATWLENHPDVDFVNYPGLASSKYHALQQKYMPKGASSVFTFGLKGDRAVGAKFMDSLQLIKNVANLGDTRTMVSHPATTTHSQLSEEQLAASGISGQTIRISVGIDDAEDILADLEQAIKIAVGK